jgi:DNA-binding helix-hairpin-helix protein with protein kinase domain
VLRTAGFKTIVVGEKLGEGGQGAVYRVDYEGQGKALKWYSGRKMRDTDKFYENLQNNVRKGAPNGAFLWPEDVTEKSEPGFGYVMGLRPPEYKDFSAFLLAREKFASVTAMTNAALHIVSAFRELHGMGYSYQDLNDGNFFVCPKTGDVLICDNDNVTEYGRNLGISGKSRYVAPEIVLGKSLPSVHTDKFSLAVILFLLFMLNHPFEGRKAYPPCMTEEIERKIYGEEPVFIFDPDDDSNRPVQGINNNALRRWPQYPEHIRQKFVQAFGKEAIEDPSFRVIEKDWLRAFIRLRGEVYKCGCGEVFFADAVNPTKCPVCGKEHRFDRYLKTARYHVALHQRTKLYACHTEADSDDWATLTGEMVKGEAGALELRNVSKKTWYVTDGGGNQVAKGPGESFAVENGMTVDFGGRGGEVIGNK